MLVSLLLMVLLYSELLLCTGLSRFQVLWKLRYQVWPRMEEGAHVTFKVPPPGIEFTLPSPKIGIESLPVVDPPWMPQVKTKVEEVTISQESHVRNAVSLVVNTICILIAVSAKGLYTSNVEKRNVRKCSSVPLCAVVVLILKKLHPNVILEHIF